jgi:hypothetical protein
MRPRTQHPEYPVHEQPVVRASATRIPDLPGNKGAIRAHCASLSSYRFTPIAAAKAETYESRIQRRVNP